MSGKRAKELHVAAMATAESPKRRFPWLVIYILLFAFGVILTAAGFLIYSKASSALSGMPSVQRLRTLEQLLAMPPDQLANVDIAEMNLLCAKRLPGAEDLDDETIRAYLARLDRWAERVKFETERHLYRLTDPRYKDHAEHYKHSEARFRAEWLIGVLQRDIGLHYHAGFVPQDVAVPPFKTSKETFIHGLMDNEDVHKAFGGNCVSLPVAYAAVARRLGYPVKLVCAREHIFCRWEGMDSPNPAWRDRFNFDGAGKGFSIDPDEFYLSWPSKSAPDQVELCGWLKNLTPQQELALFLANRGHVLSQVDKDLENALVAYAHAACLRPDSAQYTRWVSNTCEEMYAKFLAAHPEAYRQMVARLTAQNERSNSSVGIAPIVGDSYATASNILWWQTDAGRTANLAEIKRINEQNKRNMPQMMQQVQPYQQPASGVPSPTQFYHPPAPGQPLR